MKNKMRPIICILTLITMLTACSNVPKKVAKPSLATTEVTVAEPSTVTEASTSTMTSAIEPLSSNYADFNDMSIMINNRKYIFGKSTLQDMINDSVPFVDISNANNNLRANYESETFEVKVTKDHTAKLAFINNTDNNKPIAECTLSSIDFDVVDQNVLTIACPFDLSEEDLVKNAGEANDVECNEETIQDTDGNDVVIKTNRYSYTRLSERYLGDHGYYFTFKNNKLYNYTVTYR